jgi:hypothetical protein
MDAVKIYAFGESDIEVAAWARENAPAVEIISLGAGGNPQEIFCA